MWGLGRVNTCLQSVWEEVSMTSPVELFAGESSEPISAWSGSSGKRWFDFTSVLLASPLLLPLCAVLALIVYCSSRGPVFFVQDRIGRDGKIFRIYKFRTIRPYADRSQSSLTTVSNQRFTPLGSFLRRWKLDELPQLLNVLVGDMSLVGPRPKLPEFVQHNYSCRPGLTGAASLVFAREETALARVPQQFLEQFYYEVVLPAKRSLDTEYMAKATMFSDLKLILNSVAYLWDDTYLTELVESARIAMADYVPDREFGD
jgi:lipopolysaccharide/colanic/teichoic acid biosynthesis glycosyltransferase